MFLSHFRSNASSTLEKLKASIGNIEAAQQKMLEQRQTLVSKQRVVENQKQMYVDRCFLFI
jgi:hypothetical protein